MRSWVDRMRISNRPRLKWPTKFLRGKKGDQLQRGEEEGIPSDDDRRIRSRHITPRTEKKRLLLDSGSIQKRGGRFRAGISRNRA